jgi:ribosomal protein S1
VVTLFTETTELTDTQQTFAALLEGSFNRSLTSGHVVVGEIIRVDKDTLLVDIGGKYEGLVATREIPRLQLGQDLTMVYHPGQVTEFYILREFEDDTPFALSLRRVESYRDWDRLTTMMADNVVLDVLISGLTRGGILVQALTLKGFIPASQLRVGRPMENMVGETIPAKLLEVDRSRNKLILSHRAAVFEMEAEQRTKTLEMLHEELEVHGQVVKITHFGAFVDINGIDGLLPLSEISWRRLQHPSDVLTLGQSVHVTVLSIDREQERISLSMKRLSDDPWQTVRDRMTEGDMMTGQVTKLLNTGFLAELEAGIEAFCSFSRMSRDNVTVGEGYPFRIVSIAAPDRRITLEPAG